MALTNELGAIVFDDIEIDIDGRRLVVGGKDVALEPKTFAVLLLLASNPGKTLTHDDILDAVWGHRHVTQNVMHRAIALLRQALGGHSSARQYIHTVHGVGYRFDAKVLRPSRPSLLDGAPAAAGGDAPVVAAPAGQIVDAGRPVARRLRRNHVLITIAIAACVLIALAAVFLLRLRSPAPPVTPTLVVLPLQVIGDDKNEAAFAAGLSEELTTRLARVNGLRLISGISPTIARKDDFDPAQLAAKLHTTHALEGSLREDGDKLRISLRLVETPSGRTMWAQDYDRTAGDVFNTQREIAQAVAGALALPIGLARAGSRVPDPQVFREYLQLRHVFLASNDEAAYAQAERDLDALAARAPDYAPVHGLLSLNLASDFEGEGREGEALREARSALAIDPNDLYAHLALGMVASHNKQWATVKREYDTALALNPADSIVHNIDGMFLARLGYGEQALAQFETGYAADPLGYWLTYNMGTQLDVVGRHGAAKKYLDLLPGREVRPSALTDVARWRNAVWRKDFSAARGFAAQLPDDAGLRKAYAAVTEALVDPAAWPRAEVAIGEHESALGKHPVRLRLFEPKPNAADVLATFEPGDQQPGGKLIWTPGYAPVRRHPAFQVFIKQMKFIDFWNVNGWPPQCKPDGDGARCD
ncbi:MAG TPA: winged helix-turn-helix domain-containing protein [Rhodanobacteraceae bacterium]|nr:winged helix-turn-helix domain-containing protein [Rhodanobacteraceae bacterium]